MKHDQAFPVSYNGHEGMTLRDYFAAKAMQLIMAETMSSDSEISDDEVALNSYRMAEAMLNAREL
jgi:hypothetical protein